MQLINNKVKDLVIFSYDRPSRHKTEIKQYLESVINILPSTNIPISSRIDAHKLIERLDNELPLSSNQKGRDAFKYEIFKLSNIFFNSTISKNIEIQIEVINTNMCRLFHEDNMRQRLLCTYLGVGTEWLEESNLKRDGLRKGCNEKIVKNFDKIKQAKPFEVILLKGSRYGENVLSHIHRSPEIEKHKITRVILKIDEVNK